MISIKNPQLQVTEENNKRQISHLSENAFELYEESTITAKGGGLKE